MKISFDLNISLDKDKKSENPNAVATDTVPRESHVNQAAKAIAASPEESISPKTSEPVNAAADTVKPIQNESSEADNKENETPSKLDKAISVAKDGKELYDSGKEALELVSSIKTRGIIASACIVLTIFLIIFTPIFCHYWPQYQLQNRAEDAAAEARDKAIDVLEDGRNLAIEKNDEFAPKVNEAKEELGDKLDSAKAQAADKLNSAKAQAADTLDSAEKALDSKLDSAKKWLQGDDNKQDTASAEDNK